MNSLYKESDEDIQTDAEMESSEYESMSSPQASFLSQSTSGAQVIHSSGALPLPGSLVYAQSARPITSSDDDEYLKYISHMSPELQEDNIDILVINAENDRIAAAVFQNHLKKDILFKIGDEPRKPRVKLLHEIRYGSMDHLDLAFSKSLYIFLFVTKEFCAEPWTLLQGQACLTEAVRDPKKRWCVVPIHTTSKKTQKYKLPMMLNSLRPINYWSGGQDQFYIEGVRKLLESKTDLILERERLLDEERKEYFRKRRSEILKNAKYAHKSHSLASCSPPLVCPVIAVEEQLAPQSSQNISTVSKTDVCRYFSLPNQDSDKTWSSASTADITVRMEEVLISEKQTLPSKNPLHVNIRNSSAGGSEMAKQHVLQQTGSSNVNTGHFDIECSQAVSTNDNSNSFCIGQGTSVAPILSSRELDASVVVDGPEDDEPSSSSEQQRTLPNHYYHRIPSNIAVSSSEQQKTLPNHYYHRIPSNVAVSSSAHTGIASSAPTNTTQNVQTGMPTMAHPSVMRMHNSMSYGFPNQGTCFVDSMGIPAYMPVSHYPVLQPQFWPPNYVSDPNLQQSLMNSHQYPSPCPDNMQNLYFYANPPQRFFYGNIMRPLAHINEPAYYENPQLSTEVNSYDSLRSSLPHSSSTGVLGALNSLSGLSSQWSTPQFQPWQGAQFQPQPFSHNTGYHSTSVPLIRQQVETIPVSISRQQDIHVQCPEGQASPVADQLETKRTLSTANIQSSANSTGASSSSSSVIQHIHHHHHEKKITVTKATNVLIGDKSKFLNKDSSLDVVAVDDDSESNGDNNSEDDRAPSDDSGIPNSSRFRGHNSRTNIPLTNAEPNRSTSDVAGNVTAGNQQNEEASVGFAECLSNFSTRQPVEGSDQDNFPEADEMGQTYHKELL